MFALFGTKAVHWGEKSMQAELKGHFSPDIYDLEHYVPENSECISFLLTLLVGPKNQDGQESFNVTVCTPDWLKQQYSQDEILIDRHYLIMFEYNYSRLLNRIHKYLQHCTGNTWPEVALKVGHLGKWEFEDYKAD